MISLISYLIGKNHTVTCVTLCAGEHDFFKLPEKCRRIKLGLSHQSGSFIEALSYNFKRIKSIRNVLKHEKPDVVVSFLATTNILTVLASSFLPVPVIISERNDPGRQSLGRLWDGMRRLCYRMADVVSANSLNAIEAMKPYVPESKLHFVPNHLAPPPLEKVQPHKDRENVVLSVGRLHPQKAMDVLIKAFAAFNKNHPDWKLVILGQGALQKELEDLAASLDISDRVIFEGVVNNPYNYYCRSKIFVLASRFEGTPNALLEAMSCAAAPVISDACTEALSYVENNKSGLVFPVDKVQELAVHLDSLASDEALMSGISKRAQKTVESLHNGDILRMWEKLLDVNNGHAG